MLHNSSRLSGSCACKALDESAEGGCGEVSVDGAKIRRGRRQPRAAHPARGIERRRGRRAISRGRSETAVMAARKKPVTGAEFEQRRAPRDKVRIAGHFRNGLPGKNLLPIPSGHARAARTRLGKDPAARGPRNHFPRCGRVCSHAQALHRFVFQHVLRSRIVAAWLIESSNPCDSWPQR